jgi:hypothetical protein
MGAQHFLCIQCHKKYATHQQVFETLYDFQEMLLPDKLESWLGEEEEEVTLYPFLVTLQRAGDHKEFCWMPFWHVTGKQARYGQHAVCMDQAQFESLIAQVLEKQLREDTQSRVLEPV